MTVFSNSHQPFLSTLQTEYCIAQSCLARISLWHYAVRGRKEGIWPWLLLVPSKLAYNLFYSNIGREQRAGKAALENLSHGPLQKNVINYLHGF